MAVPSSQWSHLSTLQFHFKLVYDRSLLGPPEFQIHVKRISDSVRWVQVRCNLFASAVNWYAGQQSLQNIKELKMCARYFRSCGWTDYMRRLDRKTGRVVCLTGYYTSESRFRVHKRHMTCFTTQYSNSENMAHCVTEELLQRGTNQVFLLSVSRVRTQRQTIKEE
jgi:hypothetical protein